MRFRLGTLLVTPAALSALGAPGIAGLLARHAAGDWGCLELDDKEANEWALRRGGRLLSRYDVDGNAFYVITEADRSSTTVMMRSEY